MTQQSHGIAQSHRDLINEAKQQQAQNLHQASQASAQLVRAVNAIVRVNSANDSVSCSAVLDKISTIHELDREIDRQLNQDIVGNFEALMEAKASLAKLIRRVHRAMAMGPDSHDSYVDLLQRRVELVDQELRILERTLVTLKKP